jgi:hypothetical protein
MEKKRYRAETALDSLTVKTIEYLNTNFSNFSKTNKIKISLEIVKRKMLTRQETGLPKEFLEEEIELIPSNGEFNKSRVQPYLN